MSLYNRIIFLVIIFLIQNNAHGQYQRYTHQLMEKSLFSDTRISIQAFVYNGPGVLESELVKKKSVPIWNVVKFKIHNYTNHQLWVNFQSIVDFIDGTSKADKIGGSDPGLFLEANGDFPVVISNDDLPGFGGGHLTTTRDYDIITQVNSSEESEKKLIVKNIRIGNIQVKDITAEKRAAEQKLEEEKKAEAKKIEEQKILEQKRQSQVGTQNKVNDNNSNANYNSINNTGNSNTNYNKTNTDNSYKNNNDGYVVVNQNGKISKAIVNENLLDKTKYSADQWKDIQQTAAYNRKVIEDQKNAEIARKQENDRREALYKESQDKLSREIKERQQVNNQLHQIALQKAEWQEQAVNQIVSSSMEVINIFQRNADEKRAKREAAEAEAEARAERKRLWEEAEAERKALQLEMRKSLFTQYPDVKLPLSSQNYGQDELYYFAYYFDTNSIEKDNAQMYTTPVFQIHKYGDATWPYKNELLEKLANVNNGKIFKIVGFFLDKKMAEDQRSNFIEDATKYKINNYSAQIFKMKESNTKSINIDFWGNPIKN